jgi:hypothetical protein
MKKILWALLLLALITVGLLVANFPFVRGNTMYISKVCKKWGDLEKFEIEKFKIATTEDRAKMACDLLKNQESFLNKDPIEVRGMLGEFNGFYRSESYATYFIHEAKGHSEDTWQLLFLIDRNHKITEIVVHKNCCNL